MGRQMAAHCHVYGIRVRLSGLVRQPCGESFPERSESLSHLGLDGLDRDSERLCDLGVLETVNATELEHLSTAVRQRFDGPLYGDVELLVREGGVGVGRGGAFTSDLGLASLFDLEVAEVVEDAVPGRLEEVGLCGPVGREGFSAAPQLEHDVLHQLLGHSPVAEHSLRRADERAIPGPKDRVECGRVSASETFEQIGIRHVGRWGYGRRGTGDGVRATGDGNWEPMAGNRHANSG